MSQYKGDFVAGSVVDFKFHTTNTSAAPTTLSGTPVVKVYKGNSTSTEVTTGVTLTVDFDSITGLNHVRIDTSSDGTFYAAGNDFVAVITTGTVGGVSVVGAVVGQFSIENRCQKADVTKISGDSTAADNLEAILDGTGGVAITFKSLTISNSTGTAVTISSSGSNGHGVSISGNGTGAGLLVTGGSGTSACALSLVAGSSDGSGLRIEASADAVSIESTVAGSAVALTTADGHGIDGSAIQGSGKKLLNGALSGSVGSVVSGVTLANGAHTITGLTINGAFTVTNSSGNAVTFTSSGGNGHGLSTTGNGTGAGILVVGGAGTSACGVSIVGSSSDGSGLRIEASADAVSLESTVAGSGVAIATANGHGVDGSSVGGSGKVLIGGAVATANALGTQAKADVNAEVDSALDTAIPGTPTANSINERVKAIDDKLPTGNIASAADVWSNSNWTDYVAKFTGITSVANWLRALARKGNIDTTTTNEINATTGAGTGTYAPSTDALEAIRDRGDSAWTTGEGGGGGGVAGPGADNVTLTIKRTGTEIPIADADVWVTSDAEGTTVVAGTVQTDSNGRVTFLLDDGATYYYWMQKDGETSIRGESFVAEAD